MPLKLAPEDRKVAIGLALLCGVVLALAAFMVKTDQGRGASPSSYSAGNDGTKAAFLLLQQMGYSPMRWIEDPAKLSRVGRDATLVIVNPNAIDEHAIEAVRLFVEKGGLVLATGPSFYAFIRNRHTHVAVPHLRSGVPHFQWQQYYPQEPSDLTRGITSIKLAPTFYFDKATSEVPFGEGDEVPITRFSYGAGAVIWWSSFDPLSNSGIRENDNAQLLLNCIGQPGRGPVLWDEYFHQGGKTVIDSVIESPLRWGLLQALLIGAVACSTYSRSFGPVRQSILSPRLAPMEFVETLAALYQKTRKPQIAVEIVYDRFRESLQRRYCIRADADSNLAAASIADHLPGEGTASVAKLLSRIENAIGEPSLPVSEATALVREMHTLTTRLKLGGGKTE